MNKTRIFLIAKTNHRLNEEYVQAELLNVWKATVGT